MPSLASVGPHLPELGIGDVWEKVVGAPLMIVATILVALVLRWLAHRLITRVVRNATERNEARLAQLPGRAGRVIAQAAGLAHARHAQRTATMGAVLRSVVTFAVFGVALLTIMAIVGLPLGPLLASAGVGGVALGFGAQSLVKDFLSGIFMIVEDQYGVGDVIDTGAVTGTVEDVNLRVTRVRDGSGVIWYVRNGEIVRIGNRSQGWSTATVDVPVAYAENLERVIAVMREVLAEMDQHEPWAAKLLEEPTVAGVESITGGFVTLQVSARCAPNASAEVQREIRERIKGAFDRSGIAIAGGAPAGSAGGASVGSAGGASVGSPASSETPADGANPPRSDAG